MRTEFFRSVPRDFRVPRFRRIVVYRARGIHLCGPLRCETIYCTLVFVFQLGTVEGLPGGRHRNPITQKPDDALDRLAGRVVRTVHAQFRPRQHPGRLGRAAGFGPDQAHRE